MVRKLGQPVGGHNAIRTRIRPLGIPVFAALLFACSDAAKTSSGPLDLRIDPPVPSSEDGDAGPPAVDSAPCVGCEARCGNGVLESGEECDDGNTVTEACSYGQSSCTVCDDSCRLVAGQTAYCGDGRVNGIEQCDDGNTVTEACAYGESACRVCNSDCREQAGRVSFCGDGVIDANEQCDDGNALTEPCPYGVESCTVCDATCRRQAGAVAYCGDGIINGNEGCDDGNARTESCPPGQSSCVVCNAVCQWGAGIGSGDICGDGKVTGNEECDDGNAVTEKCAYGKASCTVCDADCKLSRGKTSYCGDGVVNGPERCDDGNTVTDTCPPGVTSCLVCDALCQMVPGVVDVAPAVALSETTYSFGTMSIYQYGLEKTFIATNMGTASAVLDTITTQGLGLEGPFTLTGGSCTTGTTLLPGQSCTLVVRAASVQVGTYTGSLKLPYSGRTVACSLGVVVVQGVPPMLTAGASHTCLLRQNGKVKCWGQNSSGQLGLGDTSSRGDQPNEMGDALPELSFGVGRSVKKVVAGASHTCAILDNDTVKCWGYGSNGRLGYGDTNFRGDDPNEMGDNLPTVDLGPGRTAKSLAVGGAFSCALLDNDAVKCWGGNSDGQLGLGDSLARGDGANEMGSNLPAVDLGPGRTAKVLAAGDNHVCAILDNDTLKCWGDNFNGELGLGDATDRGKLGGQMGNNLPAVDLGVGRTAKGLATGFLSTCALLDNDTIKCWGRNAYGQLGQGDAANRGDGAGEMGGNLAAIALGTGRTAKSLAHSVSPESWLYCALLDNDSVKCWGFNGEGRLGIGDTSHRGDGANEMGDNLPAVNLGTGRTARQIAVQLDAVCVLLDNDSVKCWGYNGNGQLGQGDTAHRGDGAGEMGDSLPTVDLGALTF